MANLTKAQIDELKEKGLITQVVPSDDLASKTVDGLKNEKYVTVTDPSVDIETAVTHVIPVESISLDPTTLSLTIGGTGTIIPTVLPDDATDPSVAWESSDPDKASVVDGIVTAIAEGTITITAAAGDKSATCEVTITTAQTEE